jgi:hypothetical protein
MLATVVHAMISKDPTTQPWPHASTTNASRVMSLRQLPSTLSRPTRRLIVCGGAMMATQDIDHFVGERERESKHLVEEGK